MKIIVHSGFSAGSIADDLGKPEYSYYFVAAAFLPVLASLGTVVEVADPLAEVDAIFDACLLAGEACVFLCFAPPQLVPVTLRCPTIPVIAWEFTTIPCEAWGDDPRSDWRVVLRHCGRAITLSGLTARLIADAMGDDFPVHAIPTPSYDLYRDFAPKMPGAASEISFRGILFDTATQPRFRQNPPVPSDPPPVIAPPTPTPPSAPPPAIMPAPPAPVRPSLRQRLGITLYYLRRWYRDALHDLLPPAMARFITRAGGLAHRAARRLRPRPAAPPAPPPPIPAAPLLPLHSITLTGVVYVSVFSPNDGRKNWTDLISGFLWAFRDQPGATLVLKMPARGAAAALRNLDLWMIKSTPFHCRLVLIFAYLDEAEYAALITAATYYVNTSACEGLCLPLMEFLSAGRPAIAPCHTAMADYITPDAAFLLAATLEHNVWPHDPRDIFTTMRYRLDWTTLITAYEASFALPHEDYAAMAAAARTRMQQFCAAGVVREKLALALQTSAYAAA